MATDRFGSRSTWRQKLYNQNYSKIVPVPPKMAKRLGRGTMLIPRPLDVDALIRRVGKGKLVTVSLIRARLARDNDVDVACPLTTGIFIRIAAEAAQEDARNGRKRITPYWRVVKEDGSLYDKFPGGASAQARRLRQEGHTIQPGKGRHPPRVKDFDKHIVRL